MTLDFDPAWLPLMLATFRAHPDNINGGVLHIMIEDGNFDDEDVDWCLKHAREEADVLALAILMVLRPMTVVERRQVCWGSEFCA